MFLNFSLMPLEHPAVEHLTTTVPDEWNEFSRLHREFSEPFSQRANAILDSLVQDGDGEVLPSRKIQKNARIFGARIRALIPQLQDNPQWGGQGATEKGFQRCARTVLKSLQEVLSSPEVRVAYTRYRAGEASIEDIIIDPKNISKTLLSNLGLDDFIPPKGMKLEDQVDYMAQAIPSIKEIIAQLNPLNLGQEDTERVRKRRGGRRSPHVGSGLRLFMDPEGHVIGTQGRNGNGQKVMYKTDAHGAYRRIDHIRDGYDEEIATLEHIKSTMADIVERVYTDWKDAKENLEDIQKDMNGCVDKLRHVSNDHKVELRRVIASSISFKLKHVVRGKEQERFNPGATLAKFTKIGRFVDARIKDIASIRTYLEEDQVCVKKSISSMQAPIQKFGQTVEALHERFAVLDAETELSERKRQKIVANLEQLKRKCEPSAGRPLLQPYRSFADAMAGHIDKTLEHLASDHREKAKEEFMNTYMVSRVQDLYVRIQQYYDDYIVHRDIADLDSALLALYEISHRAGAKEVAPETKTDDYNAFWGKLYHLINGLIKDTTKARDVEDIKERQRILDIMCRRFEKISFEEMA